MNVVGAEVVNPNIHKNVRYNHQLHHVPAALHLHLAQPFIQLQQLVAPENLGSMYHDFVYGIMVAEYAIMVQYARHK